MKNSLLLNDVKRYDVLRNLIQKKAVLKKLYLDIYDKYSACIQTCPQEGALLEIGSGVGFVKEKINNIITSDILPYPGLDKQLDATRLDFPDESLACICMFDVLHHIPNAPAFFSEVDRCLMPNGKLFMVEPYLGWLSRFIYHYLHHEPCDPDTPDWTFESTGPLSGANSALPYIIFERDREQFKKKFPNLKLLHYTPHTPLRYWLCGGLKKWTLLPAWSNSWATWLDQQLIRLSKKFGSFVDIEIIKIGQP